MRTESLLTFEPEAWIAFSMAGISAFTWKVIKVINCVQKGLSKGHNFSGFFAYNVYNVYIVYYTFIYLEIFYLATCPDHTKSLCLIKEK